MNLERESSEELVQNMVQSQAFSDTVPLTNRREYPLVLVTVPLTKFVPTVLFLLGFGLKIKIPPPPQKKSSVAYRAR